MVSKVVENVFKNDFERFAVDSRIVYPSYKSLDEFIDTESLRAIGGYILERIKRHIKTRKEDFFVNLHRLEEMSVDQPGGREIRLSRIRPDTPYEFLNLNKTDLWELSETAEDFVLLMDFIDTLPFKATSRILIFYDDAGSYVPAHRDHQQPEICHEFVWLRTNFNKNLYFLNDQTGARKTVEGYSAWFDAVNQYHGSDAAGAGLSFSIRVDGTFSDEFRKQIPQPEINAASTPSLWASLS